MSNIQKYVGGQGLAPRDARRLDRSLIGHQVGREIRQSRSDVEVDVAISKIQGLTMATGAGMQSIVQVATAQQSMEQMAPSASGRLAMLADMHALDVADTLQDVRHRMRRI
jgi:hypothetical protein